MGSASENPATIEPPRSPWQRLELRPNIRVKAAVVMAVGSLPRVTR